MRPPLFLVLLVLEGILVSAALAHVAGDAQQLSSPVPGRQEPRQVVNVVLVGATGDLAAKYLWVALFRTAFEAAVTSDRIYKFVAGASNSIEVGRAWHQTFFDDTFAHRVCGSRDNDHLAVKRERCIAFYEDKFKSSVDYMPLRSESQYRELGALLDEKSQVNGVREVGRIVYLAIPPQFFLESCEYIHRHVRPQSTENNFLRVVVEKPFGRDLDSARKLATHLRRMYNDKELYVMDHYAGKPVVHALRKYFQLNAALLHPFWNTEHISDIEIEMAETASVENRVGYFDSTGIIRDVMVNHLQLLLNVAVSPSFDPSIYELSISPKDYAQLLHEAQLHFIETLNWPSHELPDSLLVAQYEEYATHFLREMGRNLDISDAFTPTAADVKFTSSMDAWRNTTFRIKAAKASDRRKLAITVTFRDTALPEGDPSPCTFEVTVQRELNADITLNHRIAWTCSFRALGSLRVPHGWWFVGDNRQVIAPTTPNYDDLADWELGDERSAYDILLQQVGRGDTDSFANLDEIEASWALWTPIVRAAENCAAPLSNDAESVTCASYPVGTSPWEERGFTTELDSTVVLKEEL